MQKEHTYWVNPDGALKVRIDSIHEMNEGGLGTDPTRTCQHRILREIEAAGDVEAWADVSCVVEDGTRLRFRATAYYPATSGNAERSRRPVFLHLRRTAKGMRFEAFPDLLGLHIPRKAVPEDATDPASQEPFDEAVLAQAKVWRARMTQQAARLKAAGLHRGQIAVRCHLPGTVEVQGFARDEATGALHAVFRFEAVERELMALFAKKGLFERYAQSGWDPFHRGLMPADVEALRKALYPPTGALAASVSEPLRPLFDYEQEVREAKAAWPALQKTLGIDDASMIRVNAPELDGTDATFAKRLQALEQDLAGQDVMEEEQEEGWRIQRVAKMVDLLATSAPADPALRKRLVAARRKTISLLEPLLYPLRRSGTEAASTWSAEQRAAIQALSRLGGDGHVAGASGVPSVAQGLHAGRWADAGRAL